MNFADIKDVDVTNGPGVRVSLFVSGCPHHCPGCFNSETWDFNFGAPYTEAEQQKIIEMLDRPFIQGLSLLGGEPMAPENQRDVMLLIAKAHTALPEKDIWCYTGYRFEDLFSCKVGRYGPAILTYLDVLVDSRFEEDKKDIRLKFRGSSNQRVIDVKASLKAGKVVLLEGYENKEG